MYRHPPSCLIAVSLITTQLLGPAVLWAADQRGVRIEANRRAVVSALSGDQLTLQNGGGTKTLQFREGVAAGDRLTTGDRTMAEVLLGTRAVVTVGQGTSVQFTSVTPEQTTIQVSKGTVRVAAAASALGEQGLVTVQTPTGQVQTRGGIVRVLVDAPVRSAGQTPTGEARPYLASYSPTIVAGVVLNRGEIIQVEEGLAEIVGTGLGAKGVTLQGGQAIALQGGQAGPIVGITTQDTLKPGVVATAGHRSTPKEGMDNLVALQVDQATKLGNALTGAAETGQGQSGSKDESGKALNGATGGVALANAVANALFGSGSTTNPISNTPQDRSGASQGGANNAGSTLIAPPATVPVNDKNALLVFTRKDRVEAVWIGPPAENCLPRCPFIDKVAFTSAVSDPTKVELQTQPVKSNFTVAKELLLIGGTGNMGHGGIAPDETLIVRGAAPQGGVAVSTNLADTISGGYFDPSPAKNGPSVVTYYGPASDTRVNFSNIYVAENSDFVGEQSSTLYGGGTLSQFSNQPNGEVYDRQTISYVDAAITGTGSNVVLRGGVTLDQGTKATIGTTAATDNYFRNVGGSDAKFTGSLLSVINGPNNGVTTSVTVQDRLLGVYDGSTIEPQRNDGNKALLSVLDAKLRGPSNGAPLIDIANGKHFEIDPKELVTPDKPRTVTTTEGSAPDVKVTSAVVVRSTIPLDGALLEASAPLLALTNATMTTASHFADLAGNAAPSIRLGDALVALNASQLLIQNGHLLNLNAATATVNGYLFSLAGGSTLTLNNGSLFSLNNGSSLALNGNAFGVFGSGANTLSITNGLCAGAGSCGQLFTSANTPFTLPNGTPLKVAGTTQNVVLPSSFNVFAVGGTNPQPKVVITANDALFKVDSTSTLTINGTSVIKR